MIGIDYPVSFERQYGYVDFTHNYFTNNMYLAYNGQRDWSGAPSLLRGQHRDVARKIHTVHENQLTHDYKTNDQDLMDLAYIGQGLCDWGISHPLRVDESRPVATGGEDAVGRFLGLFSRANLDRQAGENPEDFENEWTTTVAVYLKMVNIFRL